MLELFNYAIKEVLEEICHLCSYHDTTSSQSATTDPPKQSTYLCVRGRRVNEYDPNFSCQLHRPSLSSESPLHHTGGTREKSPEPQSRVEASQIIGTHLHSERRMSVGCQRRLLRIRSVNDSERTSPYVDHGVFGLSLVSQPHQVCVAPRDGTYADRIISGCLCH